RNHLRPNNLKDAASSFASILEETPAKLAATADKVLRLYFCQEKKHPDDLFISTSLLRSYVEQASFLTLLSSYLLIFFFSQLLTFSPHSPDDLLTFSPHSPDDLLTFLPSHLILLMTFSPSHLLTSFSY
ncbi:MAG: hypothetical protein WCT23_08540, partial [Candidatus Neomarinimicrobiota bacterium]